MKANVLDLAALAHFAEHLPIDEGIRSDLARYAPRGIVSGLDASWSGAWPPAQFQVKAQFEQLPHVAGEPRSASQMVAGLPSHSSYPLSHVKPHFPLLQSAAAFGALAHAVLQAPQ